jgi:hypothetical protein
MVDRCREAREIRVKNRVRKSAVEKPNSGRQTSVVNIERTYRQDEKKSVMGTVICWEGTRGSYVCGRMGTMEWVT